MPDSVHWQISRGGQFSKFSSSAWALIRHFQSARYFKLNQTVIVGDSIRPVLLNRFSSLLLSVEKKKEKTRHNPTDEKSNLIKMVNNNISWSLYHSPKSFAHAYTHIHFTNIYLSICCAVKHTGGCLLLI